MHPSTASHPPTRQSPTVPVSFLKSMLVGARRLLNRDEVDALAVRCGIAPDLLTQPTARVTQGQFVRMYEAVALATGDEMLGLWSRPIRGGALKYLVLSLQDAPSLMVAMYRFTKFWNLLLDDYQLRLSREKKIVTISLQPAHARRAGPPQASALPRPSPSDPGERLEPTAFGHELMVKLTHGVASWLVGHQLPIRSVGFGFARPEKFHEYANLFPGPVAFEQQFTSVCFAEPLLQQRFHRSRQDILSFVRRAPGDWIFVTFDHGSMAQRVLAHLASPQGAAGTLETTAQALHLSSRSLSRKLAGEETSFRMLKEEMRRDLAIERLVRGVETIDQIAAAVGFDNTPAFHRAFRAWTGSTPRRYRGRQVD